MTTRAAQRCLRCGDPLSSGLGRRQRSKPLKNKMFHKACARAHEKKRRGFKAWLMRETKKVIRW